MQRPVIVPAPARHPRYFIRCPTPVTGCCCCCRRLPISISASSMRGAAVFRKNPPWRDGHQAFVALQHDAVISRPSAATTRPCSLSASQGSHVNRGGLVSLATARSFDIHRTSSSPPAAAAAMGKTFCCWSCRQTPFQNTYTREMDNSSARAPNTSRRHGASHVDTGGGRLGPSHCGYSLLRRWTRAGRRGEFLFSSPPASLLEVGA